MNILRPIAVLLFAVAPPAIADDYRADARACTALATNASDTTWLVAEKFFTHRASVMFGSVDSFYGEGLRAEAALRD